eukprot:TRINITY_DN5637_c0_g1_i1.p1 TRINITY_DN5637_c0_g1~~TRINITY_DN5637_c0_g1_i1.p1  ORF type:complete len:110 (-),score=1.52 TRINITY_DN5637_c0_g1_i1:180-461(-)
MPASNECGMYCYDVACWSFYFAIYKEINRGTFLFGYLIIFHRVTTPSYFLNDFHLLLSFENIYVTDMQIGFSSFSSDTSIFFSNRPLLLYSLT